MPRLTPVIVSIALAALLYFSLSAGAGGENMLAAIGRLDLPGWASILSLSLVNYFLRFVRWYGYMRWLGHRLPVARHAAIYLAGFALTTTPGKAGEGVRAVYLAKHRIPYAHCVAALFAERLLDLMAICVLAVLGLVSFTGYAYWAIIPLLGLCGVLTVMHRRPLLKKAQARVARPNTLAKRVLHMLVHAWERAFVLLAWRPLLGGLGLGIAAWAAEGISLYVIAGRLGIGLAIVSAIGIYAISMLIGALSFVPGGLGSTEAAMTVLLKLAEVEAPMALSMTLIARIATLWFAVVLGLMCMGYLEVVYRWGEPMAKGGTST